VSQKEKQNSEPQIVSDITGLLNNGKTNAHSILVDPDNPNLVMMVEVRDLTFLDMQNAIKSFINLTASGEVEIDLAGYWKYMYEKCIVSTTPPLTQTQLTGLNSYVGSQLSAVLPQPGELLSGPLGIGNEE
jgi:hypothetical protein